jgi:hypothetical protein
MHCHHCSSRFGQLDTKWESQYLFRIQFGTVKCLYLSLNVIGLRLIRLQRHWFVFRLQNMPKRTANGSPPTKKNRSRRVTRSLDKSLVCAFCRSNIPLIADHAVIYPCQCDVCPQCLLELLGTKGTKDVDCSACNTPIHSHHFHKARVPNASVVKYEQVEPQQHPQQPHQPDDRMWFKNPLKSFLMVNRH